MEKDIGKIQKGEFQGTVTEIVIGVREYNGKVGIDIREFVASDKYTGPTKKGLRIPAEHFPKFKEMINSITDDDIKEAEPAAPAEPAEEAPKEPTESTPASDSDSEGMPDY